MNRVCRGGKGGDGLGKFGDGSGRLHSGRDPGI